MWESFEIPSLLMKSLPGRGFCILRTFFASLAEASNIDQQISAERNGCWGGSDLAHFTGLGSEREGAEKGQQGREEKQKGKRG